MDLRIVTTLCFLFVNVFSSPVHPSGIEALPWKPDVPASLDLLKRQQMAKQSSNIRGVLANMFVTLAENFQALVNRQQALLDMIYCKNCGSNPWQGFLNAMSNIPTLGWVMRPTQITSQKKPEGTFIAATNVNGVVNGVGGAIYDGDPIVEYTFNNNHVAPVRPDRPQSMAAGPISPLTT